MSELRELLGNGAGAAGSKTNNREDYSDAESRPEELEESLKSITENLLQPKDLNDQKFFFCDDSHLKKRLLKI